MALLICSMNCEAKKRLFFKSNDRIIMMLCLSLAALFLVGSVGADCGGYEFQPVFKYHSKHMPIGQVDMYSLNGTKILLQVDNSKLFNNSAVPAVSAADALLTRMFSVDSLEPDSSFFTSHLNKNEKSFRSPYGLFVVLYNVRGISGEDARIGFRVLHARCVTGWLTTKSSLVFGEITYKCRRIRPNAECDKKQYEQNRFTMQRFAHALQLAEGSFEGVADKEKEVQQRNRQRMKNLIEAIMRGPSFVWKTGRSVIKASDHFKKAVAVDQDIHKLKQQSWAGGDDVKSKVKERDESLKDVSKELGDAFDALSANTGYADNIAQMLFPHAKA